MQSSQTNLFTRPDTFFGVCEALGEDLGIPSNLLRLGLAGLLFWNPVAALGAYLALAVLVAFTRWIFPNPRSAEAALASEPAVEVTVRATGDPKPMPLAA